MVGLIKQTPMKAVSQIKVLDEKAKKTLMMASNTNNPMILGFVLAQYSDFSIKEVNDAKDTIVKGLLELRAPQNKEINNPVIKTEAHWRKFFYSFVANIEIKERIKQETSTLFGREL